MKSTSSLIPRVLFFGIVICLLFYWGWGLAFCGIPLAAKVTTSSGDFELRSYLPIMRTEAGGTSYDGKFYIFGGIDSFAQTLTSAMEYSLAEDAWTTLPDLPEPINHAGVVAKDGKIYIIGGFDPLGIRLRGFMFARWKPRTKNYVYDISSREWSEFASLPEPRGAGGVTITEDAIWYVGGINKQLEVSSELFKFDFDTGQWSQKEPMKVARDHLRLESIGGELFAISGRKDDLRHNLDDVERYNIATNSWSTVAPIPEGRGGFGSAVFNGKIYTFGGESIWSCYPNVERYSPAENKWERLADLPEARHGIMAGATADGIFLVSGGRRPRVSISGINRFFKPL